MTRPVLTPAQAAVLLDSVILGRVGECIDFERLSGHERMLREMMLDLHGMTEELATASARAMITQSLRHYADNPAILDMYGDSCALCDELDRHERHAVVAEHHGS